MKDRGSCMKRHVNQTLTRRRGCLRSIVRHRHTQYTWRRTAPHKHKHTWMHVHTDARWSIDFPAMDLAPRGNTCDCRMENGKSILCWYRTEIRRQGRYEANEDGRRRAEASTSNEEHTITARALLGSIHIDVGSGIRHGFGSGTYFTSFCTS